MTNAQLEQRVTSLEQQVAELRTQISQPTIKDIRRLIGIFDDDPGMGEILDEAKKYRERDRQKTRRATRKRRKSAKA